jgi:hypothetical protein
MTEEMHWPHMDSGEGTANGRIRYFSLIIT